ncbi:transposable element Tc3 transposase [Trichonephila clavipes]|nr:transposable element Tc3 transposase [Trichonephila clavipes]
MYMLFQNDIPIDVACHHYTLNMQVSSRTKNNSSPIKASFTTITMSFNGVHMVVTGTWRSPEANPQVYVEIPLYPEKLTVWCTLWAGGIIGPYFFKNDEGHNVTVNGDRYRALITNFFIPELNNHDVQELWFQQDGATCHTARATIDLLKDTFGDRLISRFGPVNWPPSSCDLTPLVYCLWGYVKSLVHVDKPQTLDHLEDNIRRVIADIPPQMLEKVIEKSTFRLDYIQASHGSRMPEIIFKT